MTSLLLRCPGSRLGFLTVSLFFLLMGSGGVRPVEAAEFVVADEVITLDAKSSGFHFWYDTKKGPTNWESPDDFYKGQFHCRFEVLEQPSHTPCYLSFCIWGKAKPGQPSVNHTETASPLSDALRRPGSVATFSSSPSTWWNHENGGVDFSNRDSFWRWGIPMWASKQPIIPLAPRGWSDDPRSRQFWDQRQKWLPLKVHVTVVAVSKGSSFSGWDRYAKPALNRRRAAETSPPRRGASAVGRASNSE